MNANLGTPTFASCRLRVLMIGPFPRSPRQIDGGVTAVTMYLAQALGGLADIEIGGVRTGDAGSETGLQPEKDLGLPVFGIQKPRFGLLTGYRNQKRQLAAIIRRFAPDVIHGQGADLPGHLATTSGLPSFVTVHGLIGEDARYQSARMEKVRAYATSLLIEARTIRKANGVIIISPYVTTYYRDAIRGMAFEIPNAVGPRFFEVRRRPIPGRILYAGRVIPRKGIVELVEALARVDRGLNPKLVVAGSLSDSDYVKRVRECARHLGVEQQIHFTGLLDEDALLEEFATSCTLVLPSFQETAPMVIQQAMAAGLPVVASGICGIPFQVSEGVSGFLVSPGDVDALAERLSRLISTPAMVEAFGEAGRRLAGERYHASSVARATAKAYRRLIGATRPSRSEALGAGQ